MGLGSELSVSRELQEPVQPGPDPSGLGNTGVAANPHVVESPDSNRVQPPGGPIPPAGGNPSAPLNVLSAQPNDIIRHQDRPPAPTASIHLTANSLSWDGIEDQATSSGEPKAPASTLEAPFDEINLSDTLQQDLKPVSHPAPQLKPVSHPASQLKPVSYPASRLKPVSYQGAPLNSLLYLGPDRLTRVQTPGLQVHGPNAPLTPSEKEYVGWLSLTGATAGLSEKLKNALDREVFSSSPHAKYAAKASLEGLNELQYKLFDCLNDLQSEQINGIDSANPRADEAAAAIQNVIASNQIMIASGCRQFARGLSELIRPEVGPGPISRGARILGRSVATLFSHLAVPLVAVVGAAAGIPVFLYEMATSRRARTSVNKTWSKLPLAAKALMIVIPPLFPIGYGVSRLASPVWQWAQGWATKTKCAWQFMENREALRGAIEDLQNKVNQLVPEGPRAED